MGDHPSFLFAIWNHFRWIKENQYVFMKALLKYNQSTIKRGDDDSGKNIIGMLCWDVHQPACVEDEGSS